MEGGYVEDQVGEGLKNKEPKKKKMLNLSSWLPSINAMVGARCTET